MARLYTTEALWLSRGRRVRPEKCHSRASCYFSRWLWPGLRWHKPGNSGLSRSWKCVLQTWVMWTGIERILRDSTWRDSDLKNETWSHQYCHESNQYSKWAFDTLFVKWAKVKMFGTSNFPLIRFLMLLYSIKNYIYMEQCSFLHSCFAPFSVPVHLAFRSKHIWSVTHHNPQWRLNWGEIRVVGCLCVSFFGQDGHD